MLMIIMYYYFLHFSMHLKEVSLIIFLNFKTLLFNLITIFIINFYF